MLVDLGVTLNNWTLRAQNWATNQIIARKVKTSIEQNLQTIICIGERASEKENETLAVLRQQLFGQYKAA